ncbi:MAG: biotin/lipoyl-binding protein [Planctomycetota bacterium]|nr:biotin/lipoyl-binding protein [Planctomycetota bacterium]
MKGRSKILTFGLPAIGLTALVAGAYSVITERPVRPAEDPPRQPTTAPSASGAFIGAIGLTEPPGEAMAISAHVGGIVESVMVEVGDEVRAGQELFRVDTRRASREVALAESRLRVAEADLQALRWQVPTARARVRAAEASVESARAAVAAAQIQLDDRRNQLRVAQAVNDPRAIAAEEVDTRRFAVAQGEAQLAEAQAGAAQAESRLAEARAQLDLLVAPGMDQGGASSPNSSPNAAGANGAGMGQEARGNADGEASDGPDIEVAVQRVAQARADLDRMRTELELLTVRAPVDGQVLQVNLRSGEFAPAKELTDGLIVLGRLGPTHVRVQIDEVDIPRFSPSAEAWASPRGDAQLRIPLRVAYVEPLVVPKRRLSGRTSELVDTRVMEVVYEVASADARPAVGQQMDVYVSAPPARSHGSSSSGGNGAAQGNARTSGGES